MHWMYRQEGDETAEHDGKREQTLYLFIMRLHAYAGIEPLLLHVVEGHTQIYAILVVRYGLVNPVQACAHKVPCSENTTFSESTSAYPALDIFNSGDKHQASF